MKKDLKKTKPQSGSENDEPQEKPGLSTSIGIVLLAAALFNVPSILKVPSSGADWLLITIVLAMAAVGAILLFGHPKDRNKP